MKIRLKMKMTKKEVANGNEEGEPGPSPRPIAKHHPITNIVTPEEKAINAVVVPELDLTHSMASDEEFEEWSLEIYEWLSLVGIESPRVHLGDSIDPFLCRWRLPLRPSCPEDSSLSHCDVKTLIWHGLLPAWWIRNLFIELW